MQQETPVDCLIRAISKYETQSAFAAALTSIRDKEPPVTAARVWNWVKRDKRAPAEFCPDIEALTGIRCEELRPDVNWSVLRRRSTKRQVVAPQGA